MDISKMTKLELKKEMSTNFKNVGPENRDEILFQYYKLEEEEDKEELRIKKSLEKNLSNIYLALTKLSDEFIRDSDMNKDQIEEIEKLINEMKNIMEKPENEQNEEKLKKVLNKSINMGSQIALPLLVEFIKVKAMAKGIF